MAHEQEALLKAQTIVFEFPFYWYFAPAILKQYLDTVFTYGFAYGSTAKLGGKNLIYSFTTGSSIQDYQKEGAIKHDLQDFLIQFSKIAAFCNLNFYELHNCGMMYLEGQSTLDDKLKVINKARDHALKLSHLIQSLA